MPACLSYGTRKSTAAGTPYLVTLATPYHSLPQRPFRLCKMPGHEAGAGGPMYVCTYFSRIQGTMTFSNKTRAAATTKPDNSCKQNTTRSE